MNKILLRLGSLIPICIIILLLSLLFHVQAQELEINECSSASSNYTYNSTFPLNLNRLFSSLVANGTRDGFFNDTVGTGINTVYGYVSCRGDLAMEACRTCLDTATVEIIRACPNGRAAHLRYSDKSFFSEADIRRFAIPKTGNVSDTDLARYNRQLRGLMNNLTHAAVYTETKFYSGTTAFTEFNEIYGMVQCTRDLSPLNCFRCLRYMFNGIPDCCNRSRGATIYSVTCTIRYELDPFLTVQLQAPPPPPPIDDSLPQPKGSGDSSTNVVAIVVPTVGGGVLLFAVCAYLIIRRRRKTSEIYDQDDIKSEESLHIDLNTIRIATNDFSDANKLGQGGFGTVYKGKLLDGKEIAVKRLSEKSGQGSQEFKNEMVLLHKLQHRNLVRLLGYCLAGEEKLLIYEYVPNRSLDKYIFDPIRKTKLDWGKRYNIIGGIARGLLYLHEESRLRIIHRDLKAGNILLDEEMNAKIADFGMAKLFGIDQTQGNTNRIAGTFGYMAPEYATRGLFSVKSDVFSFGVLLLEIVSGQKTNNFHMSDPSRNLLSYAWKVWREGDALKLIDPTLMNNFAANEVMRCIHIGLLCVQEKLDDRPNMSSVALMLNSYSLILNAPSSPAFILHTSSGAKDLSKDMEVNNSTSSSLPHSRYGISLSFPR